MVAADADRTHLELAGLATLGQDGRGQGGHTECDGHDFQRTYPYWATFTMSTVTVSSITPRVSGPGRTAPPPWDYGPIRIGLTMSAVTVSSVTAPPMSTSAIVIPDSFV